MADGKDPSGRKPRRGLAGTFDALREHGPSALRFGGSALLRGLADNAEALNLIARTMAEGDELDWGKITVEAKRLWQGRARDALKGINTWLFRRDDGEADNGKDD